MARGFGDMHTGWDQDIVDVAGVDLDEVRVALDHLAGAISV